MILVLRMQFLRLYDKHNDTVAIMKICMKDYKENTVFILKKRNTLDSTVKKEQVVINVRFE